MIDPPIVTLLSDFGLQDGYAGVMKGTIASITPRARTIDISHQIPPQNLSAGRFCLMSAYAYFPRGSIHLAVVDPGVGGRRRGVAVRFEEGYLVGPDNGLLSGVLTVSPAIAAVSLTNPDYWRVREPSPTFHGRDIFAPAAAYLAGGVPLEVLGDPLAPESLVRFPVVPPEIVGERILGSIQSVDGFGNLIADIPAPAVAGTRWALEIGGRSIPHRSTYSDVLPGEIVPLIGSHGWVEIAVYQGNAREELRLGPGDRVAIHLTPERDPPTSNPRNEAAPDR